MEKLLLSGRFARNELDIVDHQHVNRAHLLAEFLIGLLGDGVNQLIGEIFGGDIEQLRARIVGNDVMTDGVHQVRLAQTDAAVKEQRVICIGRQFGNRKGSRMGEPVGRADYK